MLARASVFALRLKICAMGQVLSREVPPRYYSSARSESPRSLSVSYLITTENP